MAAGKQAPNGQDVALTLASAPDSSQSLSDSILAYRELHGRALYNAETSEPW
jgi:hypothetical protein